MSKLKKPVDYKQLEVELQRAIKADELYKLQNDAKLRAVEQNVPSYEHFRQMVNAAHLKPLDRAEIEQKIDTPWNTLVTRFHSESEEFPDSRKKELGRYVDFDAIIKTTPATYSEFLKTWSHVTDDNLRFSYLHNCREILLEKIFPVEISSVLFYQVLSACLYCATTADKFKEIVEILAILSKCNRFDLTVSFMSTNEKRVCDELFRTLLDKVVAEDHELRSAVESLRARYKARVN